MVEIIIDSPLEFSVHGVENVIIQNYNASGHLDYLETESIILHYVDLMFHTIF